ncbi:sulfur oxidation c-type cytochrome SoxA [Aliiroseovarius crassostreae]|uniref:sulfur oxidation c-type cytochrome SoxA n=1 Tax=Aliiroseovarius crassostreae TaxID=154981 RepID=UPI003C798C23
MKKGIAALLAATTMVASSVALADENAELIVNGEIEMVTRTAAPAHLAEDLDEVISGWVFRSDQTQEMQMDDFDNPGMLGVENGIEIWNTVDGSKGKSCADCHGEPEKMAGVKAVYPKWNDKAEKVFTLQMAVNNCRENAMGAEPWKTDASEAIDIEALMASVSRGMPVNVAIDGPGQATWEMGKDLYYTRTGQLDLSCANCHEQNYGNMIRADHLSQGHINGFPTYRLKNAKLNGVHSRFKGCVRDTRAETFKPGSDEFIALEMYVASRGNGLSVEGPSVRN